MPIESITASLLVCVRVRPLLRDEILKGHKDVLQVMDNKLVRCGWREGERLPARKGGSGCLPVKGHFASCAEAGNA